MTKPLRHYVVQLRREYVIETHAEVEVIASSPGEALRTALVLADADHVPALVYRDGEERTTFAQTRRPDGGWLTGHNG